jgi:hypothetical protein
MSEKPETEPEVQPRLEKLDQMWDEVLELCKNKGKKISAAHKGEEFKTDVQNMTVWVQECETSVITTEKATDIITATKLYHKHKVRLFQPSSREYCTICSWGKPMCLNMCFYFRFWRKKF